MRSVVNRTGRHTTLFSCFTVLLLAPIQSPAQAQGEITVPGKVAVFVRPVIDELQKYRTERGDPNRISERFYALAQKQGRLVDEALVVVMCFDVMGESEKDADAVIARGRKMLPYLTKYRDRAPKIPGRRYPDSLLKGATKRGSDFEGVVKAIEHGWRGTWDNPDG